MTSTVVKAGYWYCNSGFQPANINSSLFTHLFAAFANVTTGTYQLTFPTGYETQFQSFAQTVKSNNSDIKAILSIGGYNVNASSILATIASQPNIRKAFIDSSIDVAREFDYDGLSLNWQYPNTTDQMTNLATLLTEWRAAVEVEAAQSPDKAKLLLTAAVFYTSEYTPSVNYPIQAIVDSLDWINVMAYDLYTPLSSPNSTGPPAPLHGPTSSQLITVDGGVRAWIDAGVPANKLVLGLSFNGYGWVLENADNHGISSPADGPWNLGNSVPYRTIQDFIIKTGAVEVIDPSYVTHYCYVDKDWIGYEGKYSIFDKSRYGMEKGLLGYFAWHVADDDDAWTLSSQASLAWNNEDVARLIRS